MTLGRHTLVFRSLSVTIETRLHVSSVHLGGHALQAPHALLFAQQGSKRERDKNRPARQSGVVSKRCNGVCSDVQK